MILTEEQQRLLTRLDFVIEDADFILESIMRAMLKPGLDYWAALDATLTELDIQKKLSNGERLQEAQSRLDANVIEDQAFILGTITQLMVQPGANFWAAVGEAVNELAQAQNNMNDNAEDDECNCVPPDHMA